MMTRQEEGQEFWLLTMSVLHDARLDTEEAQVIRRWLVEHRRETEFDALIEKFDSFLSDGYVDRYESQSIIEEIGTLLRFLRNAEG